MLGSNKNAIKKIETEITRLEELLEVYDLRISQAVHRHNQSMINALIAKQNACEVQLLSAKSRLFHLRGDEVQADLFQQSSIEKSKQQRLAQ